MLRDAFINHRDFNVLVDNLDRVFHILRKHGTALSLASTFRTATTVGALDDIFREEIKLQGEFAHMALEQGIPVISECFGHMRYQDIDEYCRLVKQSYDVPFQPLGPLPTDAAVGYEHIAGVLGATVMARNGCAHIFFAITRDEHTRNIPTVESTIEGLQSAAIAAHCINIDRHPHYAVVDKTVTDLRAHFHTCAIPTNIFEATEAELRAAAACEYCGKYCPLLLDRHIPREMLMLI